MSVVQRTVAKVMRQHVEALERALEILAPGLGIENLTRIETVPMDGKALRRTSIHHGPSGDVVYVVETSMDAEGYKTRGWVPQEATVASANAAAKAVGQSLAKSLDQYREP